MTIQECYQQMRGDFSEVEKRLPSVNLIKKFIAKFLDDGSFSELSITIEDGNREKAFRAVHMLKGVAANLSLTGLFLSASKLTELLRPEADTIPSEAKPLFEEVRLDYELTVNTIRAYLDSEII